MKRKAITEHIDVLQATKRTKSAHAKIRQTPKRASHPEVHFGNEGRYMIREQKE